MIRNFLMKKVITPVLFVLLVSLMTGVSGCKHDTPPDSVTMSFPVLLELLGEDVEEITAKQVEIPGVTLSADKKTANIWGVKLVGKTRHTSNSMMSFPDSLIKVDLRGLDTSAVTDMLNMFSSCISLKELDLSSFDTSNVTNMTDMFHNCFNLVELDLSTFDTSKVTDMTGMFDYCKRLVELDLSSFDTSNVTDMNDMFGHCGESLPEGTVVYYGSGWTKTEVFSNPDYATIAFQQK